MESFVFYSPTQMIFGRDTEQQVGHQVKTWGGSRVLVVYGGQSAVKSGLLDRVKRALEAEGLAYEVLGGVQPNPRLSLARQGVKQALEFRADFLLAVGGGSVIDTAKGIADGAANPQHDLWDLWTGAVPLTASLPVGVVLTIPAAGSESSNSAVLTNDETLVKRSLGSDLHRPRFAILNPELTFTLPKYQISCGIVDIMMHTMDRYFNPICTNELTDQLAEALLRTTIRNGRLALEQPGQYQPMSELMWAGSLSHNSLTGLGNQIDFAPHQLAHELSAMFDAAHGATLAAIWGSWARFCLETNPHRFAQFGTQVWGLDPTGKTEQNLALEAIQATESYFQSIGMPISLPQLLGQSQSEPVLDELALRCTFYGKRTIGSFRVLAQPEIRAIYQLANQQ